MEVMTSGMEIAKDLEIESEEAAILIERQRLADG